MTEEIRYYMGKYKVKLIPQNNNYNSHSRVFEALEKFPCDAIQMMINKGEQYMTSYRYLQKERTSISEKGTTQK
jgi:hypothetical protein